MKTAISLPDDVFKSAERLAKHQKKSRSQLYSEAVAQYVARHSPDVVTEQLDAVMDGLGEDSEDFVASASRGLLKDVEW